MRYINKTPFTYFTYLNVAANAVPNVANFGNVLLRSLLMKLMVRFFAHPIDGGAVLYFDCNL